MDSKSTEASRPFGFSGMRKIPLKQLPGFQKQHTIPQKIGYREQEFLEELVSPIIDQELDQLHRSLRQHLQFRRQELQVHHSLDGLGVIQTPRFNFQIEASYDLIDPAFTLWEYRLTEIQNPEFLATPSFVQVFANRFNELIVARQIPAEIEWVIDTIEDQSPVGIQLDYDKDATWCRIQLKQCRSVLTLRANSLHICDLGQANAVAMSPCDLIADYLTFRSALTEFSFQQDDVDHEADFEAFDLSQLFPDW